MNRTKHDIQTTALEYGRRAKARQTYRGNTKTAARRDYAYSRFIANAKKTETDKKVQKARQLPIEEFRQRVKEEKERRKGSGTN